MGGQGSDGALSALIFALVFFCLAAPRKWFKHHHGDEEKRQDDEHKR